jgi:hypothetical protein
MWEYPGCHKPTMTGDGVHTTHKNGDDLGMFSYWVYPPIAIHPSFDRGVCDLRSPR